MLGHDSFEKGALMYKISFLSNELLPSIFSSSSSAVDTATSIESETFSNNVIYITMS